MKTWVTQSTDEEIKDDGAWGGGEITTDQVEIPFPKGVLPKKADIKPISTPANVNLTIPLPSSGSHTPEESTEFGRLMRMLTEHAIRTTAIQTYDLKIPKFDGDIIKFKRFVNNFKRAIQHLPNEPRDLFLGLQSCLTGPPSRLISNLVEVNENSYAEAWTLLMDEYDNNRKITQQSLRELRLIQPVKQNDSQGLTTFKETFLRIMTNVRLLNITAEDILVEMFLNCLSDSLRPRFEDFVGRTRISPSPQTLTNFLQKEVAICDSTTQVTKIQQSPKVKTFVTTEQKTGCLICGKNHKTVDCDNLLSSTNRVEILRAHRVCFRCLDEKFSPIRRCSKKVSCGICNQFHPTLMHPLPLEDNVTMVTQEVSNNPTLIPTAIIHLQDDCGKLTTTRCLVDLCSTRSYISESMVQLLRLKRHPINISISGINNIVSKASKFVHLTIRLNDTERIKVQAIVLPKIAENINRSSFAIPEEFQHLKFADPAGTPFSMIGALLGADVATKLFLQEVPNKITKDGLLLQPTKLGWLISGQTAKPLESVSTFVTTNESVESLSKDTDLMKLIVQFFELPEPVSTQGNEYCEELYQKQHYRLSDQILRVGGRLANASHITNSQRHPIVIPSCHLKYLLVRYTHLMNEHAPNSLVFRLLIDDYWIPGARAIIKKVIRQCPRCIRWGAKPIQPEMAQLPKERITPSQTFEKIGVDLSGPFTIKASPLKFDRTIKVWIVHFICLTTKACHLEIVSSLSSENFIAAFTRFSCRRGTSKEIWSDNGTNFVGANRMITDTWKQIVKDAEKVTVTQEIIWKFIPRHSPTFGGLWEACVKSVKYFIKRMVDVKNLTYEEFDTMLCKIEALLNSRPLHPNPLTPDDEPALTPFHFINQRGYRPSPIDGATNIPLTKKWLMIQRIQQDFWEKFRTEYLRELQAKQKWIKPMPNLETNDVVLIKEPNTSPGDWKMGRVVNTYPDPQGVVRKVDVFTPNKPKTLHAVNQLIPLVKAEPEAIPHPSRTSPRLAKGISLLHLCLMLFVTLAPSIDASSTHDQHVIPLSPGIHLEYIGEVNRKAYDIRFPFKTQVNITKELEFINITRSKFLSTCNSLEGKSKHVFEHCLQLIQPINNTCNLLYKDISTRYQTRQGRYFQLIGSAVRATSGLGRSILGATPLALTAAALVAQEFKMSDLEKQLEQTKKVLSQTAAVILNVSSVEFQEVGTMMQTVLTRQEELQMVVVLNDHVQQIELMLQNVQSRHDHILQLGKPYEQLLKYVGSLKENNPLIDLPNIGDSILHINPPHLVEMDKIVTIIYTIPLVSTFVYHHWAILSVPGSMGDSLKLSNNGIFQRILVDASNSTMMDVTEYNITNKILFDRLEALPLDNCTRSIFNSDDYDISCKHHEDLCYTYEHIYEVDALRAFAVTGCHNKSVLICNKRKETVFGQAALITYPFCEIRNSHQSLWSGVADQLTMDIKRTSKRSLSQAVWVDMLINYRKNKLQDSSTSSPILNRKRRDRMFDAIPKMVPMILPLMEGGPPLLLMKLLMPHANVTEPRLFKRSPQSEDVIYQEISPLVFPTRHSKMTPSRTREVLDKLKEQVDILNKDTASTFSRISFRTWYVYIVAGILGIIAIVSCIVNWLGCCKRTNVPKDRWFAEWHGPVGETVIFKDLQSTSNL